MTRRSKLALLPDIHKPLLILTAVLAVGTLGFLITEKNWDLWESIYFTMITVTTVGYGDYDLSPQGQKFAVVLLMISFGTVTYAVSKLVQGIVHFNSLRIIRMQERVDKLRNHTVVCGWGHLGRIICEKLVDADAPFVAIEESESRCELAYQLGHLCVQGSASDDQILMQAGVDRAKSLVCAVSSDMESILVTLAAKDINPNLRIVCRVNDEGGEHKLRRAGAEHVISPADKGGEEIANFLVHPHLAEFLYQSHQHASGFMLNEIAIREGSLLTGMELSEFCKQERSLVIVACRGEDGSIQIRPDMHSSFAAGEVYIVAGDTDAITRMNEMADLTDAVPA